MLKIILLELVKSYVQQRKNPYAVYVHYAVMLLVVSALILLVSTDILYFQAKYQYVASLLIWATALLGLAMLVKTVDFFWGHHYQRQELSNLILEALPFVLRVLPLGVTSFIVWTLIKARVARKWRRLTR